MNYYEIPKALESLSGEVSRRISDLCRYEHTLAVVSESLAITEFFDISDADRHRLAVAALLHDIAKGLSVEEYVALDKKYSIGYTDDDFASPAVLHAKAGASIAKNEFADVCDSEIISAIASHTTGGENMSLLAKILFVADYTEPTRKWDACKNARASLHSSLSKDGNDPCIVLDKAILGILDSTIEHLEKSGKKVHPDTAKCKEFILKTIE